MKRISKLLAVALLVAASLPTSAKAEKVSDLLWLYNKETNVNHISLESSIDAAKDLYRDAAVADLYNIVVNKVKSSVDTKGLAFLERRKSEIEEKLYKAYNLSLEHIWELEGEYDDICNQIAVIKFHKYTVSGLAAIEGSGADLKELGREISKQESELASKLVEEELGVVKGAKPPLEGRYELLTKFGTRTKEDGTEDFHAGIDITSYMGVDVYSCFNGVVTFVGDSSYAGNYIRVSHGGSIETYYAQLQTTVVRAGDKVSQGQKIGTVGQSGSDAIKPALHFGLYIDSTAVDPDVLFR